LTTAFAGILNSSLNCLVFPSAADFNQPGVGGTSKFRFAQSATVDLTGAIVVLLPTGDLVSGSGFSLPAAVEAHPANTSAAMISTAKRTFAKSFIITVLLKIPEKLFFTRTMSGIFLSWIGSAYMIPNTLLGLHSRNERGYFDILFFRRIDDKIDDFFLQFLFHAGRS
jgi:hypothetical protein